MCIGAVVFIEKKFRSVTSGAGAVIRDVTFRATSDGVDCFTVTLLKVWDKIFVIPVLAEIGDQRELINLELLVLWGVGIIKSPLLERDISADKVN